jgi:hypothetical protein
MYGPAIALKASDLSMVSFIAVKIEDHRKFVLLLVSSSVVSLFLAATMNYWGKIPWTPAIFMTFLNFSGLAFIFQEGIRVYNIFHPDCPTSVWSIFICKTSFPIFSNTNHLLATLPQFISKELPKSSETSIKKPHYSSIDIKSHNDSSINTAGIYHTSNN